MKLQSLLIQALGLVICYAQIGSCIDSSHQRVEQLENVPDGWTRGSRPQPAKLMKFRLAITQNNAADFEQKVIELSTPGHPNYGQHMKRDEVNELLRPSPAVSNKIIAWLRSAKVPANAIKSDGNWISFMMPISQAEELLKTKFFYFHYRYQQSTAVRTLEYSVPKDLHPYIQLIQPTTRFGNFGPQKSMITQATPANPEQLAVECDRATTPRCLRELYGIDNTSTRPEWRNRLGISGFLDQYAHYEDLEEFLQSYAPNNTNSNFSVVSINGGQNKQNSFFDSIEANLDVQYSISLADEVLATFYTTGGRGPAVAEIDHPDPSSSSNEPYLEQLHYLLNLPDDELPAVLSNSYGEDEQSLPASYVNATCSLFAQLGARGVSILFSSGDSGTGGSCLMNDGTNRTRFLPTYPSSCPFVTSVGGTHNTNPETAVYFSGGGFSEIFPRPSYQEQAVKNYLERLGSQWTGLYNPNGRGSPDVSAQATNFIIRDHGMWISVAGTRFVFHNHTERVAD
jgi:tripeptidyl-peptidase-1